MARAMALSGAALILGTWQTSYNVRSAPLSFGEKITRVQIPRINIRSVWDHKYTPYWVCE